MNPPTNRQNLEVEIATALAVLQGLVTTHRGWWGRQAVLNLPFGATLDTLADGRDIVVELRHEAGNVLPPLESAARDLAKIANGEPSDGERIGILLARIRAAGDRIRRAVGLK